MIVSYVILLGWVRSHSNLIIILEYFSCEKWRFNQFNHEKWIYNLVGG